jgi:16S rRNA processing protein RimM
MPTTALRLSSKNKQDVDENTSNPIKPTVKIKKNIATLDQTNPLFASAPDTTAKRKKKNKYAQFSKADKIDKDPFDALMEESTQKMQSLKDELDPMLRKQRQQEATIPQPPLQAFKKLEFPDNKNIDPYDPTTFGYMEIGTIKGEHGVHGWCKVEGCTDFPERLTTSGTLLHLKYPRKRAPRKVTLATGKHLGDDSFLVQLQGVYNRTAAQRLKGATLYYAVQQDTVELQGDEMIVSDLVGLSVYQQQTIGEGGIDVAGDHHDCLLLVGKVLGIVLAEEMCAIPGLLHDQIEVQIIRPNEEPMPGRPPELVLIPLVPEIVPKIDLDNQLIVVDPPEGLLDLTYIREEKVRIKGLLAPAKE